MARKYKQGKFFPSNPEKYRGDVNNIFMRSGWEMSVANWLDTNSNVLAWSSEELVIPYICETDNKQHRYFTDFTATIKDGKGNVKNYIIEVKPYVQTQYPKTPKRKTKGYFEAVKTYVKNQSKWKYAREYASRNNAEFIILTERDIYSKAQKKGL